MAREAHLPEEIPALQYVELGPRHLLRLAFDVFDAAGGAFGVGAAAVASVLEHKNSANAPATPKPSVVGVTR